jgi:hypothetical protein
MPGMLLLITTVFDAVLPDWVAVKAEQLTTPLTTVVATLQLAAVMV